MGRGVCGFRAEERGHQGLRIGESPAAGLVGENPTRCRRTSQRRILEENNFQGKRGEAEPANETGREG